MNTQVQIAADRILVRPSFADVLTCSRLGGRWENGPRAWTFPASEHFARLLRRRLRAVAADDLPLFDTVIAPKPEVVIPEAAPEAPVVEPVPVPVAPRAVRPNIPGLLTPPWGHQWRGFDFCTDSFAKGLRGVLLACGMGTGKSLIACMLILALAARRVLIACPLRVCQVWSAQFERHVGIPVVLVVLDEDAGSVAKKQQLAAEKLKLATALGLPYIVVVNYDSCWREPLASWLEKVMWDVIFADEGHRLKSPTGKASMEFKRLRAHAMHRVVLTGTPMPHGPMDIFALFRFLDVRIFGPSFSAFRAKYAVMGGYQRKQIVDYQNRKDLEERMSTITFRVGADVLDLPPATHVTYTCTMSPEAARIYKDLEEDFVARVLDGTVTAANAMVKLLRLQQVTGGSVPTDDGTVHRIDSGKQKLLADTLEDIGEDEPVVVFCRFHADLDAVHEACECVGFTSLELSGRRDDLKLWQAGQAQTLAVQISAGGVGVDLTRARYSAFYSVSFSLGEYDQALARVHRPGQTKPVTYIHLLVKNSVDQKVQKALERRAEVVNAILAEIRST